MDRMSRMMLGTAAEAADLAMRSAIIAFAEGRTDNGKFWLGRYSHWTNRGAELALRYGLTINTENSHAA